MMDPFDQLASIGGLMDVLCPMHLVLNKTGHVVHAGPTARKVMGGDTVIGRRFFELFELRKPRIAPSMEALRCVRRKRLQCMLRGRERTELKGVVAPLPDGGAVVDLSFGIGVVDAVGRYDMTSSDFAVTDLTVEMLYLVEAKSVVADAWRKLNLRLEGAKAQAEEAAHTDTLTGLGNRRALMPILTRLIEAGDSFALMHLDLDFFKRVNDTLGHAAGDMVLREVADVLRTETRVGDTIIRVGGDEFVLIFEPNMPADTLAQLAKRLISRLEVPIDVEDGQARISASIGIANSSDYDFPDIDRMMDDADIALYAAKENGRGQHVIYSEQLRHKHDGDGDVGRARSV